jgi:hypothetical protein
MFPRCHGFQVLCVMFLVWIVVTSQWKVWGGHSLCSFLSLLLPHQICSSFSSPMIYLFSSLQSPLPPTLLYEKVANAFRCPINSNWLVCHWTMTLAANFTRLLLRLKVAYSVSQSAGFSVVSVWLIPVVAGFLSQIVPVCVLHTWHLRAHSNNASSRVYRLRW